MSFNYGPNYMAMVQALQSGGIEGAKAAKESRATRGLASSPMVERLGQKIDEPITTDKALLAKFKSIQEDNKTLRDKLRASGVEEDPLTGDIPDMSDFDVSGKPMETAFKLIDDFKSKYDMTTEQAAGVVGNLWHETGGFKFMQELKPTIKGSRGGLAFAQWTGTRRDQFESLLEELGDLPADSYEGNWAMIAEELDTTERGALKKIMGTDTVEGAARATSKFYLRPGKPMMDKRISDANTIYAAYMKSRQSSEE